MTRSEFVRTSAQLLGAAATTAALGPIAARAETASAPPPAPAAPPPPGAALQPSSLSALSSQLAEQTSENEFVNHWLTDLFDTVEQTLDEPARVKLLEGCGRGCYRRHEFKQQIAREGAGSVEKLIAAYRKNFEAWREGDTMHIRYGEKSPGCYCPAAKHRPAQPRDVHCECTRMSHQTICETALGHPVTIDILQSVRRGGPTCHFLVHLPPASA